MLRFPACRTNPLPLTCALALALTAVYAAAQTPVALPTAPVQQLVSAPVGSGVANPEGRGPQEPPTVTMAPHPADKRYWISGQVNVIYQGRLPFHSKYEGTNSFQSGAEYKTSLLGTLYTALRPTRSIRYNTDLIVDFEAAGGRGLSQALGLAGFTNLDVVRNPNLGSKPYLARYGIHQDDPTRRLRRQQPRLRQPSAVHELDGGQ